MVSSSVATLDTPRREEVPFLTVEEVVTIGLSSAPEHGAGPTNQPGPERNSGDPLLHHITSVLGYALQADERLTDEAEDVDLVHRPRTETTLGLAVEWFWTDMETDATPR